MAHLNKEAIKKLSELCCIECDEQEQGAILEDLEKILGYIDQLQELNTDNVPVCNHVIAGMCNVMREDSPEQPLNRETFLKNSPAHTGGMIKVPPIMTNRRQDGEMEDSCTS